METKREFRQVTLFKEDMKYFLAHWKDNEETEHDWWRSQRSDEQLKYWPSKKKLSQESLAELEVDHPLVKRAIKVCPCSVSQARKIFEDNENLRWPGGKDIIRLGLFFHWGFYRSLNMLLKVCWEQYLRDKAYGLMKYDQKDGLSSFLKFSDRAIGQFSLTFFDEICKQDLLIEWLRNLQAFGYSDYDKEKFELLVMEYCRNQFFLISITDPLWDPFIQEKEQERELNDREYWQYKTLWALREGELEQAIFDYGTAKLRYRFINRKWYKQFGELYVKSRELLYSNRILQKRILLKNEHPDWSDEELLLNEMESRLDIDLAMERILGLQADSADYKEPVLNELTHKQVSEYRQVCKKVLKSIWRLTHPDSYQLHDFTDKQVELLDEKFEEALEINERIAAQGADEFDLSELYNIEAQVKHVWETIGRDIPDYDQILGKSTVEKIAWLRSRIMYLDKQIEQMRLREKAIANDSDLLEKKESLKDETRMEQTRRAIKEKLKVLREMNEELQRQCRELGIAYTAELPA